MVFTQPPRPIPLFYIIASPAQLWRAVTRAFNFDAGPEEVLSIAVLRPLHFVRAVCFPQPPPMHTSHTALWVTFRLVLEKKAHFEGSTSTSGLTSTVLHPHYLPPGPFPTQPRPAELSGELCCKIAPSNAPLHRPKLPVSLPWPDSPARYGQVLRAGASKTRPPMPTASLRATIPPRIATVDNK